jgi:hypothetical protein
VGTFSLRGVRNFVLVPWGLFSFFASIILVSTRHESLRSQIFLSQSSFTPFSRLDGDIFRLVLDLSDIGLHSFQTALQMHIT